MTAPERYPRVLILSRTEITEFNSQGAALGNWFRDWPKERLAHLHSAPAGAREPFCAENYFLTGRERRWGRLFDRMKRGAFGSGTKAAADARFHTSGMPSMAERAVTAACRGGKKALVDTGLGEVLCPPRMSPALAEWICRFQPEVVFAMVTDLGYMRFAQMLSERYDLPLCLEIDDDWPNTLYRDSMLGSVMFPMVDRTFRELLTRSSICLTIGKEMEREYASRYRTNVEALMCCEEPERFLGAPACRAAPPGEIAIVYCGGLSNGRWNSMVALLQAVEALRARGRNIGVTVYSSEAPLEAKTLLGACPWMRLYRMPPHEEVAGILKGADILFHGEPFDPQYHDYIRFSVSSKAQIYMLSGVPSLVYGPAGIGVVEYARRCGWAYVVDRPDEGALQNAILRLSDDSLLRGQIAAKAGETFAANHDAHLVRRRLREILCHVAAGRTVPESASDLGARQTSHEKDI